MSKETDTHASGPFSRVYFMIDRDGRLSTFTNRYHREEEKGTLVKTLYGETVLEDTRWVR